MRLETFVSGILSSNTYVVGPETSSEVLVIDPAGKIKRVIEFIRASGLSVVGVVNTHSHIDHVSGNHAMKKAFGAPVMIHEADARAVTKTSIWPMLLRGKRSWSPIPDRLLRDGDTVSVGSYDFEVIHTPGHTPGGLCLKYKKILFTGDTLMAGQIGSTDRKNSSWEELSGSIKEKLFVLSDDIACYPGHGPKTTIERERLGNLLVRYSPDEIERWFLENLAARRRRKAAEESEARKT